MNGIRNTVRSADLNLTWPLQAEAAPAAAAASTSAGAWAWLIEIKFLNWEFSGTSKEKPVTGHRAKDDLLLLLWLLLPLAPWASSLITCAVCTVCSDAMWIIHVDIAFISGSYQATAFRQGQIKRLPPPPAERGDAVSKHRQTDIRRQSGSQAGRQLRTEVSGYG